MSFEKHLIPFENKLQNLMESFSHRQLQNFLLPIVLSTLKFKNFSPFLLLHVNESSLSMLALT